MKSYIKPSIEINSLVADTVIAADEIIIETTSSLWNDSEYLNPNNP